VEAFMEVVRECGAESYDFTLRETVTSEIIDDVARLRSEIGVMYLSRRNERALAKILKKEDLSFEELFVSRPHVFLGRRHPLAKKKLGVTPKELDDYPFISFEQGVENALYFAEEVMPAIDRKKNIRVRDRATMTNLILGLNGYTVASGALSRELNGPNVVAVPLKMDDFIRVGLVRRSGISPSAAGAKFVRAIKSSAARR
jgi:DNA-binding transcriptional LysR family regulator